MQEWLRCSLISCLLNATWAICGKIASRTMDTSTAKLLQLPFRVLLTLGAVHARSSSSSSSFLWSKTSVQDVNRWIADLPFYGAICTILACLCSSTAGFLYSDALGSGGSASTVAALTASYPAVSYVMELILGMESIKFTKVLGVALAIGSSYCFAISN